jgi:hypothetical protein
MRFTVAVGANPSAETCRAKLTHYRTTGGYFQYASADQILQDRNTPAGAPEMNGMRASFEETFVKVASSRVGSALSESEQVGRLVYTAPANW